MTNISKVTAYSIIRNKDGGKQIMKYYDANDSQTPLLFGQDLLSLINTHRKLSQPIVILCIGTDRATGDCLGPLLGSYLASQRTNALILGSLVEPVHAVNLDSILEYIYNTYEDPFIIAIDACLGTKEHIGYITLETGGLYPGESTNKSLPCVGNIAITGIVNRAVSSNFFVLQSTRLHTVITLSNVISKGICFALEKMSTLPQVL